MYKPIQNRNALFYFLAIFSTLCFYSCAAQAVRVLTEVPDLSITTRCAESDIGFPDSVLVIFKDSSTRYLPVKWEQAPRTEGVHTVKGKVKNAPLEVSCLLQVTAPVIEIQSQDVPLKKPNIYLYPTQNTNVSVFVNFPKGGKITESIPTYGQGWKNVAVTPQGKINNQYDFLFYESSQKDFSQYKEGWVTSIIAMDSIFHFTLKEYGLNEREINDFCEYWTPRLKEFPYYAIYPQLNKEISQAVTLKIEPQPETLFRLVYTFKGLDKPISLPQPQIRKFERKGFTVVEWGGILQ